MFRHQHYEVVFIEVVFIFCGYYVSGLNIVEVAHDNQPVVKRFVTDDLNLTNSYDTWHGKCVESQISIITVSAYFQALRM